jgi:glycosyltransferase involved in cell wall biosynthesis
MTITAIINTYNAGKFIEEALASVLAQTRLPDEIIVFDDGSTDDTPQRMQRWADRVRYHWHENAGVSAARNHAWRLAASSWIAYLDADDLWLPDHLAQQENWIQEHPQTEVVSGLVQNFAQPGLEDRFDADRHHLNRWLAAWMPGSCLIRRAMLERTGGFDSKLATAEVIEWIVRLREKGVVMDVQPVPALRRRLHGANKRIKETREADAYKLDLQVLRRHVAQKRAQKSSPDDQPAA